MDVLPASNTDVPAEVAQAKAAYAAPTLVRWGTLRDMTLAVGSSGGERWRERQATAEDALIFAD